MNKEVFDETFLSRWFSDSITESEATRFAKHKDYKKYAAIKEASDRLSLKDYDVDGAFEKLKSKKGFNNTPSKPKVIPLFRYISVIAASVVLLLGISFYFYATKNQFSTEIASIKEIELPDNSVMNLNGKSFAKVANNWDENRNIELKGEAFFKVSKGKKFTVNTNLGKVEVLGTQFSVQTLGQNYFRVKCFEGKVKVSLPGYSKVIYPNQGVQWIEGKLELLLFNESSPLWLTENSVKYQRIPLPLLIKSVEQYYNIEIVNPQDIPNTVLFTGSYSQKDLQKALYTIFNAVGINYEFKNSKVRILP